MWRWYIDDGNHREPYPMTLRLVNQKERPDVFCQKDSNSAVISSDNTDDELIVTTGVIKMTGESRLPGDNF